MVRKFHEISVFLEIQQVFFTFQVEFCGGINADVDRAKSNNHHWFGG